MKLSQSEFRSRVFGPYGAKWHLSKDKAEAIENTALGIASQHIVDEAVRAMLAGCIPEALLLFEKAKDWLHTAVREHEIPAQLVPLSAVRYTKDLHEAQTRSVLGICRWLTSDGSPTPDFVAAGGHALAFCEEHKSDIQHFGALRFLLLAKEYVAIKQFFETCPKLKAPSSLRRIKDENKIAYALACFFAGDRVDREVIVCAYEEFLQYKMPVCARVNKQGLGLPRDIPLWMYIYQDLVEATSSEPMESLAAVFRFIELEP